MSPFAKTAVICALLGGSVGVWAEESTREAVADIGIRAQSLAAALEEVGRQTGLQIVYVTEVVEGKTSQGAPGGLGIRATLEKILEGTGLTYKFLTEKTVSIQVTKERTAREGDERPLEVTLAQGENAQGSQNEAGSSKGPQETEVSTLEEIVVTGTHIRGVQAVSTAVTVLDRAYIDATGIGTTVRLIETLPQNFSLSNPAGVAIPGSSGLSHQGASINLRGIGEGTTLVLLNGRRMASSFLGSAADIAALPLSAIERVEVLTDGASALYGSDAVGGVVNFILRRDFDGAETRLRSGWAQGGVNERRASQALGNSWESGNALLSVEYYERDMLPASERDFVPSGSAIGSLYPEDETYSALMSARQELTGSLSVFADALYTKRKSYNEGGQIAFDESNDSENPQITAAAGVNWLVGGDWQVETSASYAKSKLDVDNLFGGGITSGHERFEIRSARLKADGTVFALPGGAVRVAVGADWRSESFEFLLAQGGTILIDPPEEKQTVRSLFGEAYLPLVGAENARVGIQRLELSVAGRFDDYSSFGSSFDPRAGFMWEPIGGLKLRGSYGTSYVAPKLSAYNPNSNVALAITSVDPGASGGFSRQLQLSGTDVAGLTAQESEASSIGIELAPAALPGLKAGLNYYRINYRGRITFPPFPTVILGNPASYGSLITRGPTPGQVDEALASGLAGVGYFDCDFDPFCSPDPNFDPTSIDVIVDGRQRNLSALDTDGLDLSLQYGLGPFEFGLAATAIFSLEQQVTTTSEPFDTVDTFYNPPDWRARGSFGWRALGWAANAFINHTDSYTDNRITAAPVPVASYTTVDARLAYAFESGSGLLSGVTIAANVQDLFDREPPRAAIVEIARDMGFDPTNANPMGRLISLEIGKVW